jgi:Na+/H+-dicarboxylate symporter
MSIVDLREVTLRIASSIANTYIDFPRMTCSLVAVVGDAVAKIAGQPLFRLLAQRHNINIARVVVNVIGNSVATIAIARREHAFATSRATNAFATPAGEQTT